MKSTRLTVPSLALLLTLPLTATAMTNSPQEMIDRLVSTEEKNPTQPNNVQQRLEQIKTIFRDMIAMGLQRQVGSLLTRQEMDRLEQELKNGQEKDVVPEVKKVIRKMATLDLSQAGNTMPQDRRGPGGGMGGGMERNGNPWTMANGRGGPPRNGGFNGMPPRGGTPERSETAPQATFTQSFNIHQELNGGHTENILKLRNPAIDPTRQRLYVGGSITNSIAVIDLRTDRLIETFDIGMPSGYLVYTDDLYSFDFERKRLYRIDPDTHKVEEEDVARVDSLLPRKRNEPQTWKGYTFQMTGYQHARETTGFPTDWRQDLNAAYGVIEVRRTADGDKQGEILSGVDSLYFTIHASAGKLYAANTGEGSVTVFDLNRLERTDSCAHNRCQTTSIDLGTSIDQIVTDPQGGLYVRNRLGGSQIIKLDAQGRKVWVNDAIKGSDLPIWPTGMALDSRRDRLYALGHYTATIAVLDSADGRVLSTIPLPTTRKPRTDSLSTLAYAPDSGLLFAAIAELGQIWVVDTASGQVTDTLALEQYGFDGERAANRGPGWINLAVDDVGGHLFVSLYEPGMVLKFATRGGVLKEVAQQTVKQERMDRALFFDAVANRLHLGGQTLDADLTEQGEDANGGNRRVVAQDTRRGWLMYQVIGQGFGPSKNEMLHVQEGSRVRKCQLGTINQVPSSFAYREESGELYYGQFERGVIKVLEVADCGRS